MNLASREQKGPALSYNLKQYVAFEREETGGCHHNSIDGRHKSRPSCDVRLEPIQLLEWYCTHCERKHAPDFEMTSGATELPSE
jgi:hypothetical protein